MTTRNRIISRRNKHVFAENIFKDHIGAGIIGASCSKGSDPSGNKSYICSGRTVSAVCGVCNGLLSCDSEMVITLDLLYRRYSCYWNSLYGGYSG